MSAQLKALVDPLLTDSSNGYFPTGYISESVLTPLKAKLTTGKIGGYGKGHLRIENSNKAGRNGYRRVDPVTRTLTGYSIDGHGLEDICTKDDYRNVIDPFKAEEDKTIAITHQLWLEKEVVLANALSDTAVLTQNTTLAGAAQFSDYANSDPLAKAQIARSTVKSGCGAPPDTVIMSWEVWNVVRFHPQMMDAVGYKYARPGGLTNDELATALGVKRILVGEVSYNSAKEGQTDVLAPAWGKHMIFAVLPESPQLRQITLGYLVGYDGEKSRKVYKYAVNNPPEATGILVEDNYDMVIVDVGAGYLIRNAIA
jgi:hypothetical protein